jgi:hypothetical protein
VQSIRILLTTLGAIAITYCGVLAEPVASNQDANANATGQVRWTQSYNAGYTDKQGAYVGGSEIMHLVAHKGKLFAANGYWVDAHWIIPPDEEKQSAQVLRLDTTGGKWQVDLDLGKANGLNLRYMKGNILKSVTFTRDASGNRLPKSENLLVMAAGANFERGGAVSAWVRDDTNGTWKHTLVRHGSNAGGVRWVPRDIEVYTDKVTGIERLFLLLGNPGIISGTYDPSLPATIRWERNTEFPFLTTGSLKIRPLGIVQANGSLYFSAGSSIYVREDGARPTYTEILKLNSDTDTDVGGIRGLTAISNPNGPGQSLLFLWAPGHRSTSQVKRLDPDGKGGYTIHDEANMRDLMSKKLGVGVSYTLGAHNMMYPVTHPVTGKTVHIIGFQGNLQGKADLRWHGSNLYGGAMYAVRTAKQTYSVHEVNNAYAPGKAVLVSPRAFCLSPFDDNHLFIGGHDSSRRVSDDMSWVFKAPLESALGIAPALDAQRPPAASPPEARLTKGPVYELRIYTANENRYQHLIQRFREHTDRIFKKHGLEPLGYWIPIDHQKHRRKFIYILKHPSRYAAYKNWVSFSISREWEHVLDQPVYQRLLTEKPISIFMTANDYSEVAKNAIEKEGGVYELRTYVAPPGKLSKLNSRFRDHTTKLFHKHGIHNVGYWTPFDRPEINNTLVYLIHHASRKQADANWKAFTSDPRWKKVARQSQQDGQLLAQPPESIYLKAMEFSPLK